MRSGLEQVASFFEKRPKGFGRMPDVLVTMSQPTKTLVAALSAALTNARRQARILPIPTLTNRVARLETALVGTLGLAFGV